MSERNGMRYGLLGLGLILLIGLLTYIASRSAQAPTLAEAPAPSTGLESLKALEGKAPSKRTLDIQQWQTAEGAKVLFVEARQLPMFDLRLTFAAGSSHDDGVPGLAALTNAMLNEGVPGKDVTAIAEGFESLGAEFGNGAYRDMAIASLRSLSAAEQREPALALFDQVIGQPTFPQDALARIKNQLLAGFEYQKQNPGKLAGLQLFERLYGTHPYAHPSEGSEESIPGISVAQLQAFHQKAYAAGNVVIALVGDLSRAEAEAIASKVSASLPKGPALPRIAQPEEPKAGPSHIEFPSNQTHLMLAQLGVDRREPDYAALMLGNQILGGGGFGTRLMEEVREKRGLTYGIYSGFSAMQARGPFMINLQTRAELSEGTLKLVQDILTDYLANGPTQKELDEAKREMVGSFPLTTASNADIVGQLGSMGFYNLPLTYLDDFMSEVQGLSVEQVKAAMAKHLATDKLVIVTAGPTVAQKPLPPPTDKPAEQPAGPPEH
ncbi:MULTISPECIES: pitrilysin family protein [unclassified Pseudomonas]|uniref:M16 family metallopeptidase n=1 Tax=unclassified Pseudomonas TaxID=196821 RepID=UPI00244BD6D5|nr:MULTISPECIES: pitrilysin family protein [unclassified Pseudomonas]MDG9922520.1 insulinase family protein [Pseudomonas sp. GD04045]MDH0034282.1 insulinase family protein [Pseudomonas sp. GD04019]